MIEAILKELTESGEICGAIKKIQKALDTDEAAGVRLKFRNAYYRDKHGSLRRVFPKAA